MALLNDVCLSDVVFAEVTEKVEAEENYEQLAKDLENASPLEIMDKALEKFGNDIAIAFRYLSLTKTSPKLNIKLLVEPMYYFFVLRTYNAMFSTSPNSGFKYVEKVIGIWYLLLTDHGAYVMCCQLCLNCFLRYAGCRI